MSTVPGYKGLTVYHRSRWDLNLVITPELVKLLRAVESVALTFDERVGLVDDEREAISALHALLVHIEIEGGPHK